MGSLEASSVSPVLVVESEVQNSSPIVIFERKGLGHPDTLADHLAEELSRAYSQWTLERFGAVLHHNFDKLALLGGRTEVRYGGGEILDPIRVLVNGRATRSCGGVQVPLIELVQETVNRFFSERLPEAASKLSVELNVTSNPSPGAVHSHMGATEPGAWFSPSSIDDLRERKRLLANDTSLGTGWAPLDPIESFALLLTEILSGPSAFRAENPWCGSDVKMMTVGTGRQVETVLCVPQKSAYVPERAAYLENCRTVLRECQRQADLLLPDHDITFKLNTRDIIERDELYLTYTGSSIESGDEGVVGRGNRVNGLITPLRPMNLEGANGKNPVYHVGKLYNVAAQRIAARIHETYGGHVEVHLVSATGQPLASPWRTVVRMTERGVPKGEIEKVCAELLADFPLITHDLVYGDLRLA